MHQPPFDSAASRFLPTSRKECTARGWDELDVIVFSGDAYVDHPSFGAAVIARLCESFGLKVALVPQPNWRDDLRDFTKLGQPRLFFAVSGGAMDSMVNHYTASKRLRSDDAYTPGGTAGQRPDRAVTVYTRVLKQLFPTTPVMVGGIEASLRRLAHYDYWSDTVMPSILADSGADLLIHGMGEAPLSEILRLLKKGVPFSQMHTVRQTAWLSPSDPPPLKAVEDLKLPSFESCKSNLQDFNTAFRLFEEDSVAWEGQRLLQTHGSATLVVNPRFPQPDSTTLDSWYNLPFTRLPHPRYHGKGPIAAYEMIKHSITLHRGCYGACSFCAIAAHQGKQVTSRSHVSILREVESVKQMPDFHGVLSDIGGATANMYQSRGINLETCKVCRRPSCLHPAPCPNLGIDHGPLLALYESIRNTKGIKKAFVASGVRYDMLFNSKGQLTADGAAYAETLVRFHVSGRLKVAPEHADPAVLAAMRKPSFKLFEVFAKLFTDINQRHGMRQEIIPYFISSHPGSTLEGMATLAAQTRELCQDLEQVQEFTPTPMTLSSAMYYTGRNPYTNTAIAVARKTEDRKKQHLFFFWQRRENKPVIAGILAAIGRDDLAKALYGNHTKAPHGRRPA